MSVVQVSNKGQIVIPKELRERYDIVSKQKVEVVEIENHIGILPLLKNPIKDARGILKMNKRATKILLEERARDKKLEEKRIKRWI